MTAKLNGIEYVCPSCEGVEWRSFEKHTYCFVCDTQGIKKYSSFDEPPTISLPMGLMAVEVPRPTLDNSN